MQTRITQQQIIAALSVAPLSTDQLFAALGIRAEHQHLTAETGKILHAMKQGGWICFSDDGLWCNQVCMTTRMCERDHRLNERMTIALESIANAAKEV